MNSGSCDFHSMSSLLRQHSLRTASQAFPEAHLLGDSKFTETEPLHKALPSRCPLQHQSFCLCVPLNPHAQPDLSVLTDGHLSEILGAKQLHPGAFYFSQKFLPF